MPNGGRISFGSPAGSPTRGGCESAKGLPRRWIGLQNRQGGVARRLVGSIPAPPRCTVLPAMQLVSPRRGCWQECNAPRTAQRTADFPSIARLRSHERSSPVSSVRPIRPAATTVRNDHEPRDPLAFLGSSSAVRTASSGTTQHRVMSPRRRFRSRSALAVTVVACAFAVVAAGTLIRSHDSGAPAAEVPSWQQALRQIGHRYAACLRQHGHPQIADPTLTSDGRLSFGAQDDAVSAASRALRGDDLSPASSWRSRTRLRSRRPRPSCAERCSSLSASASTECPTGRTRTRTGRSRSTSGSAAPARARSRCAGAVPAPQSRQRDPGQPFDAGARRPSGASTAAARAHGAAP